MNMKNNMNFRVYKITCNITGKIYYGSTQRTIASRLKTHETRTNTTESKHIIKNGDYKIEQIKKCFHQRDMKEYEDYCIRNFECINVRGAILTKEAQYALIKKWCENNKDKIKSTTAKYRANNKDKIKANNKKNKEKIKIRDKIYYEKNKEYIRNYKHWCSTSPIGILARSYF